MALAAAHPKALALFARETCDLRLQLLHGGAVNDHSKLFLGKILSKFVRCLGATTIKTEDLSVRLTFDEISSVSWSAPMVSIISLTIGDTASSTAFWALEPKRLNMDELNLHLTLNVFFYSESVWLWISYSSVLAKRHIPICGFALVAAAVLALCLWQMYCRTGTLFIWLDAELRQGHLGGKPSEIEMEWQIWWDVNDIAASCSIDIEPCLWRKKALLVGTTAGVLCCLLGLVGVGSLVALPIGKWHPLWSSHLAGHSMTISWNSLTNIQVWNSMCLSTCFKFHFLHICSIRFLVFFQSSVGVQVQVCRNAQRKLDKAM